MQVQTCSGYCLSQLCDYAVWCTSSCPEGEGVVTLSSFPGSSSLMSWSHNLVMICWRYREQAALREQEGFWCFSRWMPAAWGEDNDHPVTASPSSSDKLLSDPEPWQGVSLCPAQSGHSQKSSAAGYMFCGPWNNRSSCLKRADHRPAPLPGESMASKIITTNICVLAMYWAPSRFFTCIVLFNPQNKPYEADTTVPTYS